ncbi:hypothetical protein [Helicobacter pylori]|uniref:hypothetical protein n=1 Tax=Helicobacter pylori TaxID=210 RepID=UPI000FDD5D99|nr:hypothetical protein [Helicobacter pylori]RVZ26539.1 hypothetical protein EC537_00530 [Helicobacter pylori]
MKLKGFSYQYLIIIKSKFFNKGRSVMLENFKKAVFRALCLCCVLIGGGVNGSQTLKSFLIWVC